MDSDLIINDRCTRTTKQLMIHDIGDGSASRGPHAPIITGLTAFVNTFGSDDI